MLNNVTFSSHLSLRQDFHFPRNNPGRDTAVESYPEGGKAPPQIHIFFWYGFCLGKTERFSSRLRIIRGYAPMFRIQIDETKCNCCGLCAEVCPNDVLIKRRDGCSPAITDRECPGCENCVVVCETGALRIIKEDSEVSVGC